MTVSVRRVVPDFPAQDPGACVEFYVEVLGLEVIMDHGWIVTFAAPGNPGAQISVMHPMDPVMKGAPARPHRSRS